MPDPLFEPWTGKCFGDKASRRRERKGVKRVGRTKKTEGETEGKKESGKGKK